jgi:hypothetical protein
MRSTQLARDAVWAGTSTNRAYKRREEAQRLYSQALAQQGFLNNFLSLSFCIAY